MERLNRDDTGELMQSHLFQALDEEQWQNLLPHISKRSLAQGEHLFQEGDAAEAFFLLRHGQVKLYRLSPNGQEKVIEIVSPGQSFAEALMFLELPAYPVSAQALSDVELFVIANRGFVQQLSRSVETCFRVMGNLSVRLRGLLNEIDALTLQNATLRLVNYLLRLYTEQGEEGGLTLPAAKNIIASRLSIQPETLSRILTNLSAEGLIRVDGLTITVLDTERLRCYGE